MSDMEQRLRDALHAGADVITAEPQKFTPTATGPSPATPSTDAEVHDIDVVAARHLKWHHRRDWLLAAAAVVALAAGGTALGLHANSGHDQPPAGTHAPKPKPKPETVKAEACTVTLPQGWESHLRNDFVAPPSAPHEARPGAGLVALGVTAKGATVAVDTGTKPQSVVAVSANREVHKIWTMPRTARHGPDEKLVATGGPSVTTGDWVVFDAVTTGGADAPPFDFYAANAVTGVVRRVTPAGLSATSQSLSTPVVVDGTVYFSATSSDNGLGVGPGSIYAYDLADGQRRVLDHGDVGLVAAAGGGVSWRHGKKTVTYRAGVVPPGFPAGTSSLRDGNRQAWVQAVGSSLEIRMSAGTGRPVTVLRNLSMDEYPSVLALTGPFLAVSDQKGLMVLDTRTGAQTRVAGYDDFAAGGGGRLVVVTPGAAKATQMTVMPVAKLPGLHC